MEEVPARVGFENAIPILHVADLEISLDYYTRVLGFTVDWRDGGVIASVSPDGASLYLVEGDQGNPGSWVWMGVEDVESLFEEYRRSGATIRHPPTNYPWAYEMQVQDPDRNVLRLGSEPKAGQPI